MWIARDKDGNLSFFPAKKPIWNDASNTWYDCLGGNFNLPLDNSLFPELTWEDEPIEISLCKKVESIDDVELNKLAREHCMRNGYSGLDENEYVPMGNSTWGDFIYDIEEAYKVGYRKAKEE